MLVYIELVHTTGVVQYHVTCMHHMPCNILHNISGSKTNQAAYIGWCVCSGHGAATAVGGTAWAVQMAMQQCKPIYVFHHEVS